VNKTSTANNGLYRVLGKKVGGAKWDDLLVKEKSATEAAINAHAFLMKEAQEFKAAQ